MNDCSQSNTGVEFNGTTVTQGAIHDLHLMSQTYGGRTLMVLGQ